MQFLSGQTLFHFWVLFRDMSKNSGDLRSCFTVQQSIPVRLNTFGHKYCHISVIAEEIKSKTQG